METLLQNIASVLWIVLGVCFFFGLRKWSKRLVQGRWIPFHSEAAGDIQYCSICGIGFDAKTDYCPHCGAKMDGGEDCAVS